MSVRILFSGLLCLSLCLFTKYLELHRSSPLSRKSVVTMTVNSVYLFAVLVNVAL